MKKKILLLLTMLTTVTEFAFAQPSIKNQKVIGGNANDFFSCMAFTKDGGLIAGGTSYSGISGQKTDSLRGTDGGDYWIIKLDAAGNIQWDKTIGGTRNDQLTAIQQTKDGGYILGGYSQSDASADKQAPRIGALDYWIAKLDAAGNIQWDKTYGLPEEYFDICELYDLKQTGDGGYIMTGTVVGEDYEEPNWVIKTDASGNMEWNSITGGEEAGNNTIIQTKDGGYMLGSSTVDHIAEKTSYRVVKFDKNGVIQWKKIYGAGEFSSSYLYSILQMTDNSYLLAGSSDGWLEEFKTDTSRGRNDYWLLKIDSLGNALWDKTIGGNYYDYLRSIDKTADGGLILGGYSYSNASGEKTENNSGGGGLTDADYWIVKLNKQGIAEWDKTIGGDTTDVLLRIRERKTNQYVLGGYSYSGISGDKTKPSRGGADYWITGIQYNTFSARQSAAENITAANKQNINTYIVYPNPVKDILRIQNTGKATFTLTNPSGKIILTKIINGNGEINVAHLPAGIYYLKDNETGTTQKIMIVK